MLFAQFVYGTPNPWDGQEFRPPPLPLGKTVFLLTPIGFSPKMGHNCQWFYCRAFLDKEWSAPVIECSNE
jgi:hypothetical protein